MKGKDTLAIVAVIVVGIILALMILRIDYIPGGRDAEEHSGGPEDHAEHEGEGPGVKGPHGGRLLSEGDFKVEVTLYERGVPPQFRVYAYEEDKALRPDEVQLTIELHRLGGRVEAVHFQKEGEYLRGDRTIEEPHSFDAKVIAERGGRAYRWEYAQVEGRVELSPAALQSAGIEMKTAGPAPIKTILKLPGQIQFNQNRLVHVVPRIAGVATEVHKNLGDPVHKGEVIAVLESRELADLKSQYLASLKRLELARATFEREKRLWEAKISAEQDYLLARKDLAEAEIAVDGAAQKLIALGLSKVELGALARGAERSLARYELRTPLDGVVIEKHIVLGEALKEDTPIFVLADLSSVWGEITVYANDLGSVKLGQKATVRSAALGLTASGTVSYLGPLVGEQTRAAKAHVDIPNPQGLWRPGLFVTVEVVQEEVTAPVVVAAEAIQTYRDWAVVFVQYGDLFEVRPLELGRSDGEWVEVVKGLETRERYAARGSFVLKAELGKAGTAHEH